MGESRHQIYSEGDGGNKTTEVILAAKKTKSGVPLGGCLLEPRPERWTWNLCKLLYVKVLSTAPVPGLWTGSLVQGMQEVASRC